ncbi:hypothetical protein HOH87_06260 [bacterium]|jgi:hypothetical protein|nr:hypothetical protein [bacterium]
MPIQALLDRIPESIKTNMRAMYSYGNHRVLVIFEDLSDGDLRFLREDHWTQESDARDLKVMTVTEMTNSLDVFPIEFLDIQENAELIYGTDLLDTLKVDRKNLRHECEFYLRSYVLSLREDYIAGTMSLTQLVDVSMDEFLGLFRRLVEIWGDTYSKDPMMLMDQVAAKLRVSLDMSKTLLRQEVSSEELEDVFLVYLDEMTKIGRHVDQMDL